MFDAKSLLDVLMRGGGRPQTQESETGGLADVLRSVLQGRGSARPDDPRDDEMAARAQAGQAGPPGQQSAGGLEEMLRTVLSGQGGLLGDVLGRLRQHGGGLADMVGQVLGQAASGGAQGAQRIDAAAGTPGAQAASRSPEEVLAQLKELIANNRLGAGAALGGLGALVLGTGTGRSLAGSALKLGGLALVGGLAYKAYQDYRSGQPVPAGAEPQRQLLQAAPDGSGFESAAMTDEHATLFIRAMIAAAAADGRIDEQEQQKILGGLKQAGLEKAAQQFLTRALKKPATAAQLAKAVSSPEEGVQVYTAARLAVDPDLEEEHAFLAALAERLGIDETLAAHIDATARSTGA